MLVVYGSDSLSYEPLSHSMKSDLRGTVGYRVEVFGTYPDTQMRNVRQQLSGCHQSLVDANDPFKCGSLMKPFQPTVVRGFSKYTRMRMHRLFDNSLEISARFVAVFQRRRGIVNRTGSHD